MRRAASELREELFGRRVILAYLCATLMTTAEGTLVLVLPPYLDGYGYALPAIGTLLSLVSVMRLVSRVPVGTAYRAALAKRQLAVTFVVLSVATGGFAFAEGRLAPIVALTLLHGFAFGSFGTLLLATVIDLTGGRRSGAIMAWYTAALSIGYSIGAFLGGALADALGIPAALLLAAVLPLLAVFAVLALPEFAGPPHAVERAPGLRGLLLAAARLDPRVWLAFVIVVYVNIISDAIDSFFPLYGLAIGIPLAGIGVLKGLKSAAATAIRFASLAIFRFVDYRAVNFWAVIVLGLATFLIPVVPVFAALAVLFLVAGLCRGILRVTSAATVAELRSEGKEVGLAAGVYNAGLDTGAIVGPAAGGLLGSAFGLAAMFQVVAVGSIALYLAVAFSSAAARSALAIGGPAARRAVAADADPGGDAK